MEYDKEFEAVYAESVKVFSEPIPKMFAYEIWKAARKDHYRIGEEVEAQFDEGYPWVKCVVMAYNPGVLECRNGGRRIRRISSGKSAGPGELQPLYETFEKMAFAVQKLNDVLEKAVKDGTYRARNASNENIPEWMPKEGDAVFCLETTGDVLVGSVALVKHKDRDGIVVQIRTVDGILSTWPVGRLKPFSIDKIGKPWEEI